MLSRAVETFLDGKAGSAAQIEVESPLMAKEAASHPPTQGEIGLVHHVPFALLYQKALGSRLERAYLNTTHAKMYLAIVSHTRRH
jgi:ceramide glucosyltransferase